MIKMRETMIAIRELNLDDIIYTKKIAELHKRAFPNFFLTQLGIPFLVTLYRGYIEDEHSGIIVAEENDALVGFIAYSKDYSGFYKGLIDKHLIRFAFCSIGAAFWHPSFIKRLLSAFKKGDLVKKEDNYVELASICVEPIMKHKGVGAALLNYLKSIVNYDEYSYINLETDAENNDSVNEFYKKNGFILSRQYTTKWGRKMNEYYFRPENNQ